MYQYDLKLLHFTPVLYIPHHIPLEHLTKVHTFVHYKVPIQTAKLMILLKRKEKTWRILPDLPGHMKVCPTHTSITLNTDSCSAKAFILTKVTILGIKRHQKTQGRLVKNNHEYCVMVQVPSVPMASRTQLEGGNLSLLITKTKDPIKAKHLLPILGKGYTCFLLSQGKPTSLSLLGEQSYKEVTLICGINCLHL